MRKSRRDRRPRLSDGGDLCPGSTCKRPTFSRKKIRAPRLTSVASPLTAAGLRVCDGSAIPSSAHALKGTAFRDGSARHLIRTVLKSQEPRAGSYSCGSPGCAGASGSLVVSRSMSRSWSENMPLKRSDSSTRSRWSGGMARKSPMAVFIICRRGGGSCCHCEANCRACCFC